MADKPRTELDTKVARISDAAETPGEKTGQKRKKGVEAADEQGGPSGPEPTRYGDWERGGIAKDF